MATRNAGLGPVHPTTLREIRIKATHLRLITKLEEAGVEITSDVHSLTLAALASVGDASPSADDTLLFLTDY